MCLFLEKRKKVICVFVLVLGPVNFMLYKDDGYVERKKGKDSGNW